MRVVLELLVLGFVVGANNLAMAMTLGTVGQKPRRARVVAVFGAVEFVVPLLGLLLGRGVAALLTVHAQWLGSVLLASLALWLLISIRRSARDDQKLAARLTTWSGLLLLALALSVDNLIVGFSLGMLGAGPLLVASTIALCSMLFTYAGIGLGAAGYRKWGRYAKALAGVLLLGMAAVNLLA